MPGNQWVPALLRATKWGLQFGNQREQRQEGGPVDHAWVVDTAGLHDSCDIPPCEPRRRPWAGDVAVAVGGSLAGEESRLEL
jgi:hypothetical protein